jgi:cytochrome c551/c552
MKKYLLFSAFVFLILAFSIGSALSTGIRNPLPATVRETGVADKSESSVPQDKDHGIGPIKNVELGPLNKKMIDEGKSIFTNQCVICHEMDQKKLGPPLRNVTKERTPEYIMNLLLNSVQMQKDDPLVKSLLKQYNNLPMPDPALNQSKARSVLEYLRSNAK